VRVRLADDTPLAVEYAASRRTLVYTISRYLGARYALQVTATCGRPDKDNCH
jgi:hypothetical protein